MTATPEEVETAGISRRRHDRHWLVWDSKDGHDGPITGCHCGFLGPTGEDDYDHGDSIIDHIETVVRAEAAAMLPAHDAALRRQAFAEAADVAHGAARFQLERGGDPEPLLSVERTLRTIKELIKP